MSAPTAGSAGGSPTPGFYPDPSIPGYIRYWNGASWVPGTSRPAPAEGEPMPAPPPGVAPAPAAVEETGPVFLDETGAVVRPPGEIEALDAARAEGAAWHADASRQGGFGEDGRISWGASGQAPAGGTPQGGLPPQRAAESAEAAAGDAGGAATPAVPADGTVAFRAVNPGAGRGPGDQGTTAFRAVRPGPGPAAGADQGTTAFRAVRPDAGEGGGRPAVKNETMAFRLPAGNQPGSGAAGGAPQALPATGAPAQQGFPGSELPTVPRSLSAPGSEVPTVPQPLPAPGSEVPTVPQPLNAHQPPAAAAPAPGLPPQGGPSGDDGVIPWKPPTADVFFAAAQAAQGHPASLGRRLAARLIDTVVLAAATAAAALPLWSTVTDHLDAKVEAAKQSGRQMTVYLVDGTTAPVFLTLLAVVLIGGGLYEALPTLKWGRTLGKKLCGVRVLDIESHGTPEPAQAIKRWLVYGVLGVLAVGVVNALWCLFDKPWRQCWHDKAARTFVAADRSSD
ncbi:MULTISPECIES: RDD family protein [unclassified Streptomyces]|uniref:RDD family protein n=1 Tax=unclassified Streptomyces TaxID=2593676 RepID=UPI00344CC503